MLFKKIFQSYYGAPTQQYAAYASPEQSSPAPATTQPPPRTYSYRPYEHKEEEEEATTPPPPR